MSICSICQHDEIVLASACQDVAAGDPVRIIVRTGVCACTPQAGNEFSRFEIDLESEDSLEQFAYWSADMLRD